MSSSLRPQYFVAREDGTLTPLIAVDELPSTVQIIGVPATLSPAGTQNMISLGLKERSSQRYEVSFNNHTDHAATPSATNSSTEEIKRSIEEVDVLAANVAKKGDRADVLSVENWRRGVKSDGSIADDGLRDEEKVADTSKEVQEEAEGADKEATSPEPKPKGTDGASSMAAGAGAGTKGTIGRKVYCTHWIRWGECDYTQQGCLYKHEMPEEDQLQQIGIATYPRWYRLAHPEKCGGITEVPEYHRRPGPAPTDQLWRSGSKARSVPPQSWDEFRQNATVPRSPMNNQATSMTPTFIVSPYPGPFNPFMGGFIPQHQQQLQYHQQWNKAPATRVSNMDSSSNKKSTFHSATDNNNTSKTSSTTQKATEIGGSAAHPTFPVASVNPPVTHTTRPSLQTSLDAQVANAGSKSTLDNPPAKYTIPHVRENISLTNISPQKSNFSNNTQPTNTLQPSANEAKPANGVRNHSISSAGLHSDSAVNEVYRPLVPSATPVQQQQENVSNGFAQDGSDSTVLEPPQGQAFYRRFFVNPGEPRYVSSPVESSPLKPPVAEEPTMQSLPPKPVRFNGLADRARNKGKRGGYKTEKMDIGSLVDV